MKSIVFVLFALCVGTLTLYQESQLRSIEHNKYQMSISDPL